MADSFIYKSTTSGDIKGDFYPAKKKQAPLIVFIHGGGLIWGSKSDMLDEQIELYQQNGFNVCSINYRLAPEAKLPQITEDIQDALTWLKEKGTDSYDFDPERIAVVGASAGGYLALLTGTFPVKPKAIISFYGYGNILADWYTKPSTHFANMTQVPEKLARQLIQNKPLSEAPIERRYAIYLFCRQQGKWNDYVSGWNPVTKADKLRPFCPAEQVDATFPPTFLLHGDTDKDVPQKESEQMADILSKSDVPHQLMTIPNGEHQFDLDMQQPIVQDAFQQVINFLQANV